MILWVPVKYNNEYKLMLLLNYRNTFSDQLFNDLNGKTCLQLLIPLYKFWIFFLLATRLLQYYTCLLYTSPSPRDRQKSRMPSSA